MFYRDISRLLAIYLFLYAGILLLPLSLAAYYQFWLDPIDHPQLHSTAAFGYTIMICLGLAFLFFFAGRKAKGLLYRRESLASVVFIWLITPAIGALPFVFSGTLQRLDQAYFEAVSGFTTTGTTILEGKQYDPQGQEVPIHRTFYGMHETTYTFYGTVDPVFDQKTGKRLNGLEAVGRALLFWRSWMQWLGGMGIIVLFVALLPALGVEGKVLYQTETPGPIKEGWAPRIKETALQLWEIYTALTLLEVALLIATNKEMPLFDAFTIAFSNVSTGGFSIHNENVTYYQHPATEWLILIFMVLGSLNFALYYYVLKGKFYRLFESEFLLYLSCLLIFGGFISYQLIHTPIISLAGQELGRYSFFDAIRTGYFQLVSAQSSTGFFTANYDTWPATAQVILLVAMYFGGMSGSTSGGIKMIRFDMFFRIIKNKIESIFQPRAIRLLHVGGKEMDHPSAVSALAFFFIVIAVSASATFLYVWDNIDLETAFSLTACMINNTGLAFRGAGPANTEAFLSPFSMCLSIFIMILGRLEFYAVLVMLLPSFWKKGG